LLRGGAGVDLAGVPWGLQPEALRAQRLFQDCCWRCARVPAPCAL